MSKLQHNAISRRSFLKAGALTVGGALLAACAAPAAAPAGDSGGDAGASMETLEIAPLGLGRRAGRGRL